MSSHIENSTVRVAIEVSFQVGRMDYGTIQVPAGTKVMRHVQNGKAGDWFVKNPSELPDNGRILINGKHSSFFVHDATHYGISIPNANVGSLEEPKKHHTSFHY